MNEGRSREEDIEQRLEELRLRLARAAARPAPPKRAGPHWISIIAAAVAFTAALIYRDFVNHPEEAFIFALVCAAVIFCAASVIHWIIQKTQGR